MLQIVVNLNAQIRQCVIGKISRNSIAGKTTTTKATTTLTATKTSSIGRHST